MEPVLDTPLAMPGATSTAGSGGLVKSAMVADMARMLNSLHRLASAVLDTVTPDEARRVFVTEQPVVIDPLPDPASRPRGSAHPLLQLVKLVVSSARLQTRVLQMDMSGGDELAAMEGFVQNLQTMALKLGLDPHAA